MDPCDAVLHKPEVTAARGTVTSCATLMLITSIVIVAYSYSFLDGVLGIASSILLLVNFASHSSLRASLLTKTRLDGTHGSAGMTSGAPRDCCCAMPHIVPMLTATLVFCVLEGIVWLLVSFITIRGNIDTQVRIRFFLGWILPAIVLALCAYLLRFLPMTLYPALMPAYGTTPAVIPVAIPVGAYAPATGMTYASPYYPQQAQYGQHMAVYVQPGQQQVGQMVPQYYPQQQHQQVGYAQQQQQAPQGYAQAQYSAGAPQSSMGAAGGQASVPTGVVVADAAPRNAYTAAATAGVPPYPYTQAVVGKSL